MRRLAALIYIAVFIWMMAVPAAGAASSVRVLIDGRELTLDVPPRIESGTTLVPLRAIFEALEAEVGWDAATRTITAVKGSRTVWLQIGNPVAEVSGAEVRLSVPAAIYEGRTLVPLRFVSEALGARVEWDGATRTVFITTAAAPSGQVPGPQPPAPPGPEPAPAAPGPAAAEPTRMADMDRPHPFETGYFPGMEQPRVVLSQAGIEVTADDRPMKVSYPLDPYVARTLLVKNTGSSAARVQFEPAIAITPFYDDMFINHPQPPNLYLEPGQSHPIRVVYTLLTGGPNVPNWRAGDKVDVPITVTLRVERKPHPGGDEPADELKVVLPNVLDVVSPGGPDFQAPAPNATVRGRVYDATTGRPIAGVAVELFDGHIVRPAVTDAQGQFAVAVYAHRWAGREHWLEYTVTVDRAVWDRGYAEARTIIAPRAGETVTVDLPLAPRRQTAAYQVTRTLDLGLQAYDWDMSRDGSLFATVPFHTTLPPETLARESFLTAFNAEGDLLWRYPLGGESTTVDVADDGSLVATLRAIPGERRMTGGIPIVVNRSGELVYEMKPQALDYGWGWAGSSFSEVALSPDNRYLAAGDVDGGFYLVDWKADQVVFSRFFGGQIRFIRFAEGDRQVFVSSGDGYLRALDLTGRLRWQAYVDSWAFDLDLTPNHILVTSKAGRGALHLIDPETGEFRFSYPTEHRGSVVRMAPDETWLWYSTEIGGGSTALGSTVFNMAGTPLFDTNHGAITGAITADSQYLAVSTGCTVALVDRQGRQLWEERLLKDSACAAESMNHLMWISPAADRIVVTLNQPGHRGTLYVLKGGVRSVRP